MSRESGQAYNFFERHDIEYERFEVVRCVLGYKTGFETLL